MANAEINKLQKKSRELNQQIKEAQRRRNEFAGAFVLRFVDKHPESEFARLWSQLLNEQVTKSKDRKLMGLSTTAATVLKALG